MLAIPGHAASIAPSLWVACRVWIGTVLVFQRIESLLRADRVGNAVRQWRSPSPCQIHPVR